jgi:Rrf2 family nitric oxide-sensitive transcriptional repressor
MQLSTQTDFSLRVLMYLAKIKPNERVTTPALAKVFNVSQHHLHKVVQNLRRLNVVETTHGNNGGVSLLQKPSKIRLGTLIRELESVGALAHCERGPCPLCGACVLKGIFDAAEESFYDYLDKFTLDSTLKMPTVSRLEKLISAHT